MKNSKKGFTLIELLVVLAIIGILSAIVIAGLTTARSKGGDTKVKAQMSSIRNAAELYYTTNGDYGTAVSANCRAGIFADTSAGMARLVASSSYAENSTIVCNSTTTAYAVSANLISSAAFWCVDNSGTAKQEPVALGSGVVACP